MKGVEKASHVSRVPESGWPFSSFDRTMREPLIWHLDLRSVESLGKANALAGVIIWSECCCVARTWPANSPLVPHFAGLRQPIVPGRTVLRTRSKELGSPA